MKFHAYSNDNKVILSQTYYSTGGGFIKLEEEFQKKFIRVFKTIDMEDCVIDARTTNSETTVDLILKTFEEFDIIKKTYLKEKVNEIKTTIITTLKEIFN